MATNVVGTLYTLHFDPPYKHARHYEGWTSNPTHRFAEHLAGRGSKLVKAAIAAGCQVIVVRVEPGTRADERRLKNRKDAPARCKICRAAHLAARRDKAKAKREVTYV